MATVDANGYLVADDYFHWDQWGVWRTCPRDASHVWGDTYDDIADERKQAPENLTPESNAADCPYCHPELRPRYWSFYAASQNDDS